MSLMAYMPPRAPASMKKRMSDQDRLNLSASDLPITLYLNQRLTFDLLAVLKGGFSSFSTVQTTSSGETTTNAQGKAQIGVSNVFAFLGVDLGAQGSQQSGHKKSENTTEEIVHTPASLFAQLRKDIHDRKLVRFLSPALPIKDVRPSDFVEFEATLRRSPMIDILDTFEALVPLIQLADEGSSQTANRSGESGKVKPSKGSQKQNANPAMKKQIDLIKSAVTAEGAQDFIAEIGGLRIVLTTEQDYFIDPSMNDIIDGTFRVFGKATRVVSDDTQSISLFRKTALGRFKAITETLGPAMEHLQDAGFSGPIETAIPGPTMQVIPIAIFS